MPDLIRNSVAWVFGHREVPFSSRVIFRNEIRHICCWGLVWGSLNGGFCGYIALSRFEASDVVVSIITAAMAFANLLAVWWAELAGRVPKKKLMASMLAAIAVLMFLGPLLPLCDAVGPNDVPPWFARITSQSHPLTSVVFSLQIVLAWVMLQGVNAIRTIIWKSNYADEFRGRILARFAIWQMLIGAVWVALMGAYLDGVLSLEIGGWRGSLDLGWLWGAGIPSSYSFIFPVAGLGALLSLMFYRSIKIRAEHRDFKRPLVDRVGTGTLEPNYTTPGWFATRGGVLRAGLIESARVLKHDPSFRQYMSWVFLSGSSIMMVQVPFVLILRHVFEINYLEAAGLLTFVPQVVVLVFSPLWARLFDHWPLFLFRAVQVCAWVVSRFLLAVGVWMASMPLVLSAVVVSGVAMAGGRFAWQLGHMGFSSKVNDKTYLGIHQTLAGIRGLLMPFGGAVLYRYVFGWHIIWISGILLLIAAGGYWRMHCGSRTSP